MDTITNSSATFCSSSKAQPGPGVCNFYKGPYSSTMSAAAGQVHPMDAKAGTNNAIAAGVKKQPVKGSKPHDSYLLRYQELKHMRENKNPHSNNQQQSHDTDNNATDGEMPQISEKLDDKKTSKGKGKKSKLCVIL